MSVLIKGIPLGGYEISIMRDGDKWRARVDGIWCEVEEIPTPHGRLIDADVLRQEIHCWYSDDLEILEHIDEQPTVIEAEE